MEEIEACIADQKNIEEEIEVRELACIIESFLDTLTIENRVIFMRRYWFSDSYKDIAEFVGLSEKNISVRLTRIREKMKQYLIESNLVICQANFWNNFDMYFRKKGNFNRPMI